MVHQVKVRATTLCANTEAHVVGENQLLETVLQPPHPHHGIDVSMCVHKTHKEIQ